MYSFLITGGTIEKRNEWIVGKLKDWGVGKFDVTQVAPEETSIGIDVVRELRKTLLLKPIGSPFSVGIIRQAESLTIEAQNALLKTLEEPPPRARVVLESQTADVFLPTIISRCHLVRVEPSEELSKEKLLQCFKTIEQILVSPVGQRMKLLDEVATNRDEAAAWVDLALTATRAGLLAKPGSSPKLLSCEATKFLRSLLLARQELTANVNYKLVLDNIFLPKSLDKGMTIG